MSPRLAEIIYENKKTLLLEENYITIRDIIQGALSAAAEYGLIATVVGAPEAPAVETAIDLAFLANSLESSAELLADIGMNVEKAKQIFEAVFNRENYDLSVGFDQYYEKIKSVWQRIDEIVPEFGENVDEYIDIVKRNIDQTIRQIADIAADAFKVSFPDAIGSFAIGQAVKRILTTASNNSYTLLTSAISASSILTDFIQNPDRAVETFSTLYDKIIEILQKVADKLEEESRSPGVARVLATGAATMLTGPLGGLLVGSGFAQRHGSRGLNKAIEFMQEHKPKALTAVRFIFDTIIPVVFALAASKQILMKNEWSNEDRSESQNLQEIVLYKNRLQLLAGIVK